ncbi:hypothetical protein BV898_01082 [Hypsibius exemplaris]|uniref:Uncharacterized protein n=1 Tax=Hypsibius exemplaris TaxID=2072580 RepID=A0A1W0XD46_HYPEX|nr:hypothetical protein BV898_01082 [Hypsibius exemplaris]
MVACVLVGEEERQLTISSRIDMAPSSSSSTNAPSSSPRKPGTTIISPSNEFDHADALSLVESARAAGLNLPENANFIFLPPAVASGKGAATQREAIPLPKPLDNDTPPVRLRERRRPPTSTKKFVTTALPAARGVCRKLDLRRVLLLQPAAIRRLEPPTTLPAKGRLPSAKSRNFKLRRFSESERPELGVGSDELTWEPRTNFSSDNEAWLAFKAEQKKRSASRSRAGKRTPGDKEASMETTDTMDDDDDSVNGTGKVPARAVAGTPVASTSQPVEKGTTVVDKKAAVQGLVSEGLLDKLHNGDSTTVDQPSSSGTTRRSAALPKPIQQNGLKKDLSTPEDTVQVSKPADALSSRQSRSAAPTPTMAVNRAAISPSIRPPLRHIAPLPRPGETVVRVRQINHGNISVYLPNSAAGPSSEMSFDVTTPILTTSIPIPATAPALVLERRPTLSELIQRSAVQRDKPEETIRPKANKLQTSDSAASLRDAIRPRTAVEITRAPPTQSPEIQVPKSVLRNNRLSAGLASLSVTALPAISPNGISSCSPRGSYTFSIPTTSQPAAGSPTGTLEIRQLPLASPLQRYLPRPSQPPAAAAVNGVNGLATQMLPRSPLLLSARQALAPPQLQLRRKLTREVATNTSLQLIKAKDVVAHAGTGRSGLDAGALVVNISGFKPRTVAVTCLDDIAFLVTYANRDPEFVDYQECIRKIPHEVATFLFLNKINAIEVPPLRIVP